MAIMIIDDKHLEDIAEAIREKTGGTDTYKPREMADAIASITTGTGGGGMSEDVVASYPKIVNVMCWSADDFEAYAGNGKAEVAFGTVMRYVIDTSIYENDVTLTFKYQYISPIGDDGDYINEDGARVLYRFNPIFTDGVINENSIISYGLPFPSVSSQASYGILMETMKDTVVRTATLSIPANINTVAIESFLHRYQTSAADGKTYVPAGGRGAGRIDLYDFAIQGA
jgi:hypothetical protein